MSTAELKDHIIAWIIATDNEELLERISDLIECYDKESIKMNAENIEAHQRGYNKN